MTFAAVTMTDADCIEAHLLMRMLADDPGNRRLQEAARKLINRWRDEGKLPLTGEDRHDGKRVCTWKINA